MRVFFGYSLLASVYQTATAVAVAAVVRIYRNTQVSEFPYLTNLFRSKQNPGASQWETDNDQYLKQKTVRGLLVLAETRTRGTN